MGNDRGLGSSARALVRPLVLLLAMGLSVASVSTGFRGRRASQLPAGPMPAGTSWFGDWQTTFGPLKLVPGDRRRNDPDVLGTYQYGSVRGYVGGDIRGNQLVFVWVEKEGGAGHGRGTFAIAPNGRSFTGTWGTGNSVDGSGNWDGNKVGDGSGAKPAAAAKPGGEGPAGAPNASLVPAGDGWFCYVGDRCLRTIEECKATFEKNRTGTMTSCRQAPAAWCHTFEKGPGGSIAKGHECRETEKNCKSYTTIRWNFMKGDSYADNQPFQVSGCAEFK